MWENLFRERGDSSRARRHWSACSAECTCTAGTRLRPPALRYHNIPSYHIKELKTVTLSEKKVLFLSEKKNKNKLQPRRKNKHTSFSDCSFGLTSSSLQFIGTLSDDADIFWSILVNKRQVQRYVYMCLFWREYLYRDISEYFLHRSEEKTKTKKTEFKHGTRISLLSHQIRGVV